jgi:hypothetical protein
MTRLRTALALTLAGLLLALGACSEDDPRPKIAPSETPSSPTGSASASESPSPSAAPPVRSKAAQEAALRKYFESISEATSTGDPSAFVAASSSDCVNCRVLANNIRDAYANGGYVESADWRVNSVRFQKHAPLGMIWNVQVDTPRERWFNANGEVVKIIRPASMRVGLAVILDGETWVVRELRINT